MEERREKDGRREKERKRRSVAMVASLGWGWGKRRRVESRRKYRLFYYAKAFSAVGSFRLRAVALPIESRRRRRKWCIVGGGSSEKASAPESRKYGQPFCDKLFSARFRSSSLRAGTTRPRERDGEELWTRAPRTRGRGVVR